jgi:hypothetical protein
MIRSGGPVGEVREHFDFWWVRIVIGCLCVLISVEDVTLCLSIILNELNMYFVKYKYVIFC